MHWYFLFSCNVFFIFMYLLLNELSQNGIISILLFKRSYHFFPRYLKYIDISKHVRCIAFCIADRRDCICRCTSSKWWRKFCNLQFIGERETKYHSFWRNKSFLFFFSSLLPIFTCINVISMMVSHRYYFNKIIL